VPVYSVGSERGVHYYAMQYIEGRDLASVLAQLREQPRGPQPDPRLVATVAAADAQPVAPAASPAVDTLPFAGLSTERSTKPREYFRTVTRLGIQAAEALDYAHQMGIVHRDVKSANLLVDAAGRLWVTDFGLAQMRTDTRLTMTGVVVGTLRYMSPEQALAKRGVVDHRTDVYSLGTTLYELLTLEPAFNGCNPQELLRQIAFEEPRPPGASIRQCQRSWRPSS
jgi:serine/threonine protein kinase